MENISLTALDSISASRRKAAISKHPVEVGIDFVNTGDDGNYKLVYLNFIPSVYEGKQAVPDLGPRNLRITDSSPSTSTSSVNIKDITKGRWMFDIESPVDTSLMLDSSTSIICENSIDIKDKSFTVEFWVKRTISDDTDIKTSGFQVIIGRGPVYSNQCLNIGFNQDDNFCFMFFGDDLTADVGIKDSFWHHFACVYDAPARRQIIYLDGEKAAERFAAKGYTGQGDIVIGDSSLNVYHFAKTGFNISDDMPIWGRAKTASFSDTLQNDYHFKGSVADIRFWNIARKQDAIKENMYLRLSGDEQNLAGYWPLVQKQAENILDPGKIGDEEGTPVWIDNDVPIPDGYSVVSELLWEYDKKQPIDTCINLDGDYRAVFEDNDYLAYEKSFTVEFWAKRTLLDQESTAPKSFQIVAGRGPLSPNRCFYIGFKDNDTFIFGLSQDDLKAAMDPADTLWHHFACSYDADLKKQFIYIDGQEAASKDCLPGFIAAGELVIGNSSWDAYHFGKTGADISQDLPVWGRARTASISDSCIKDYGFNGLLAEFRIWNTARSQEDIENDLYTRVKESSENLAGCWQFLYKQFKDFLGLWSCIDKTGSFKWQNPDFQIPQDLDLSPKLDYQIERIRLYEAGDCLSITLDKEASETDFSVYTLNLLNVKGMDRFFSETWFSFNSDSEFDPGPQSVVSVTTQKEPEIDYLTKDYNSFEQVMSDRLSCLCQDRTEPLHSFDQEKVLIDLLAYSADYLSYYQDAVATEAYLGTAQHRISIVRHARMLDYDVHEGCNARVFVFFETAKDSFIQKGTKVLTKTGLFPVSVSNYTFTSEALPDDCLIFETMHDQYLFSKHNEICLYTWGGTVPFLEEGATKAYLKGEFPDLKPGHVLIFEQVKGVSTGLAADAEPSCRQAVRLSNVTLTQDPVGGDDSLGTSVTIVEWMEEDALEFDLYISKDHIKDISVARGNIVLADHGWSITETLTVVPNTGKYRPRLEYADITYSPAYDHSQASDLPVSDVFDLDPRKCVAQISLTEQKGGKKWEARRDLLEADSFTRNFVAEVENDRRVYLRFGDNTNGMLPAPYTVFEAIYRVGNGNEGNISRDSLGHLVADNSDIVSVRNPLSALAGAAAEDVRQVRLHAPFAFHNQKRCVTTADYIEKVEAHPKVQRASATIIWTGTWNTIVIAVDRMGSKPADTEFCDELRLYMEDFRLAGSDIAIVPPNFVGIDIAITVSIESGYFKGTVEQSLTEVFSSAKLTDSSKGFFHTDNFTFGQPVYLSRIIKAAKNIKGIEDVEVTKFQRWGDHSSKDIELGKISIGPIEIARLDNDIDAPENGIITFNLIGGISYE